jgi:hypothetical protein
VPCEVHILEYDRDGNHDPINRIPSEIRNGRLNVQWEYEYHEDTDEIPTEEELQHYGSHYNPPEYFFVVEIEGQRFGERQEGGLLKFRDWVALNFSDAKGQPKAFSQYKMKLSDGTVRTGTLNVDGYSREGDLPPGKIEVSFTDSGIISIF